MSLDASAILSVLLESFPGELGSSVLPQALPRPAGVTPPVAGTSWPALSVAAPSILRVARFLRHDGRLEMNCLSNLSAVDRKASERIQVWYHLLSYRHRHQIALVVDLDRQDPVLASVTEVWPAANWLEREAFDLMGVRFTGHPDLRRILMPEDWVGHPLRKDFVEPDEYHGISTRRESLLKL